MSTADAKNPAQKIGIILLGFGGPDSLEAVEPFLTNLMGRPPHPQQVKAVTARYQLIGGRSPLLEIAQGQAAALERQLKADGYSVKTYVGMRYWHPLIEDTLKRMFDEGTEKTIALSLSPHFSRITTGSYIKEVKRVSVELGLDDRVVFMDGWHTDPLFIEAMSEKTTAAMEAFGWERSRPIEVIFSAHSLPVRYIEEGDPYLQQIKETVAGVVERLRLQNWHLSFQSRGGSSDAWLEPETADVLTKLAQQGKREVVIVPVSFVSDHIETLYDIDIVLREKARELGIGLKRAEALNDSPTFIKALAQAVEGCLG